MTDPMPITHRKIASLAPTWREFRGLSVLFDNPGADVGPGIRPLGLSDVPLYDALAELVAELRPDEMRDRYGFCPLPRESFHVTLCDGPNDREIVHVPDGRRAAVEALLATLPDSLPRVSQELGLMSGRKLADVLAAAPVTFRPSEVVRWGQVLVTRLEPADTASAAALRRVARSRATLVRRIASELEIAVQAWRPHVSLGYFANAEAAEKSDEARDRWQQLLARRGDQTVGFASAALYGFTDMVSFFRYQRGTERSDG